MKRGLLALVCVALLAPSFSAQATWRGDKRQDARDIRKDSREQGRDTKQECVRNNKTAAKVARKHVTKNGETEASASSGRHSSHRRSL